MDCSETTWGFGNDGLGTRGVPARTKAGVRFGDPRLESVAFPLRTTDHRTFSPDAHEVPYLAAVSRPPHQPSSASPVRPHEVDDDAALVAAARAGDRRAFDTIVLRHQSTLYNVAVRVLRDPDDAIDAVQTTFTKAWDRLDTFDPSRRLFSWLYRIALNTALNERERRRPQESIEDVELVSGAPGPEDQVHGLERRHAIERALAALPVHYREVVVLRHFAELSYDEIADAVGVEPKTVKSRLFTARTRLADLLRPRMGEAEA